MDERGFTLIELLVGLTLVLGVMMATFRVLDDSIGMATRDTERGQALRGAQVGLERMLRELRHTRLVHTAGPQVIDVTITRRGVDRRIAFDCSVPTPGATGLRRCTRASTGQATEVLIDRVHAIGTNSSAFAYTPTSGTVRHVTVRLAVVPADRRPEAYDDRLVLTNGTMLRNVP